MGKFQWHRKLEKAGMQKLCCLFRWWCGLRRAQLPAGRARGAMSHAGVCHPHNVVSPAHSLGLVDEVVRLVPVSQQVCRLLVVHSDVVIRKQAGEKIINFPGHIQNVVNASEHEKEK